MQPKLHISTGSPSRVEFHTRKSILSSSSVFKPRSRTALPRPQSPVVDICMPIWCDPPLSASQGGIRHPEMYVWVLHGMDKGQVGCSREIKPPHALDLRFVKAHCA